MINRRSFVLGLAGMSLLSVLLPNIALGEAEPKPSSAAAVPGDFYALAAFLIHRPANALNTRDADAVYRALMQTDADFAAQLSRLQTFIRQHAFADVAAMSRHQDYAPPLQHTVKSILKGFYLGYVGAPTQNVLDDKAFFITYTTALMYAPTADTTVIPSFSRGKTDYWVSPPPRLAQDKTLHSLAGLY